MNAPQRLRTRCLEKLWGLQRTEPWYRNPGTGKIGEVWFEASDSLPLVKFLFTSENLSVQVHPEDAYAMAHHRSRGKTEMWHILRAEPGAQVAIGPKETISTAQLRGACEDGSVVDLLNWVPARAGDTFFTPAGTVHAIGAGLTLCEVQQLSDITYRLYDYGRPNRELHHDPGMAVAHLHPHDGVRKSREIAPRHRLLAECQYFRTELLTIEGSARCHPRESNALYLALDGEGTIAGLTFVQGDGWEVPAGSDIEIASPHAAFLITFVPSS